MVRYVQHQGSDYPWRQRVATEEGARSEELKCIGGGLPWRVLAISPRQRVVQGGTIG